MSAARFEVRVAEWAGYGRIPSDAAPPPLLLRRRLGPIVRRALEMAWNLQDRGSASMIVSSRHGEFNRTLAMLDDLAQGHETSPADFSLAVHNAPAGLLAIASGCRLPQTAIAAGPESFCYGLMEAAMMLAENPHLPVLLLHYDTPLPGVYSAFNEPGDEEELLVLCLRADSGWRCRCEFEPAGADRSRHGAAASFAALLADETRAAQFESGRMRWRWSRCDA